MTTDIRNLDEALAELDRISVHTTQGDFVKMEDVRRLIEGRVEVRRDEALARIERGPIRTVEQARAAARRDPDVQEFFSGKGSPEPGAAVPASEPQPASRPLSVG